MTRLRPRFTFAVLTDTHLNPEDATSSSPWLANRLANRRAAAIVAQINALAPDFVIHLGDVVHPVPGQPGFEPAVARYRAIFGALQAPLRCVPGNHDIGDKPTDWMPAPVIAPPALAAYRAAIGPDRDAFDHDGCRFVLLNAMLINSGLPEEAVQWRWLDSVLPPDGGRAFVCLHYPPFLFDPREPEHYDNLAEPGRARLLALLRARGVEAVFAGHVHNIFVNRDQGTDFHVLPATSAIRHDYSELFPVPPPDAEHGRDNVAKLGFHLVEVFETGHAVHWVRSWGEIDPARAAARTRRPALHPRTLAAPIGVDLRHDWARPVTLPYTGVVDEFSRKQLRNDYLTMQIQGLGLRHLRVPLQDVVDPVAAGRMAQLAGFGHRFTVFAFGLPAPEAEADIAAAAPAIERLEVVLRGDRLDEGAPAVAALARRIGLPVVLSRLSVSAEPGAHAAPGARYAHFIRTGFRASEAAERFASCPEGLAGLAFRIERAEPLWPALDAIAAAAGPLRALVHLRLAAGDPAEAADDDADTARLVAAAVLAAHLWRDRLDLVLDTLADHDRGYFPRHGLIDRRADPRAAGRVLAHLTEVLADAPGGPAGPATIDAQAIGFTWGGRRALLWLPGEAGGTLDLPLADFPGAAPRLLCLDAGVPIAAEAQRHDGRLRLIAPASAPAMPRLVLPAPD
jgi:predicted phosphodiesterase